MTSATTKLAFLSAKGGSGKTVIASSLATLLGALGLRVLLVDTDAATNGLTILFLEQLLAKRKSTEGDRRYGLFEATDGYRPSVINITTNIDLVPASFILRNTEKVSFELFIDSLSWLVKEEGYDLIILDAQAGADAFAQIAASLCDIHVLVSEYDPISVQGIDRLKVLFANEIDPSSTYTLFNKILPEFAALIGEGLAVARYLPPITWDADVVRAFAQRDLAIVMEAPNPFTLAISQLALGCLNEKTTERIEYWRGEVYKTQTGPMKSRLERLQEIRRNISRANQMKELMSSILWVLFGVSGSFIIFFIVSSKIFNDTLNRLDILIKTNGLDYIVATFVAIVTGSFTLLMQRVFVRDRRISEQFFLQREIETLQASVEAAEKQLRVQAVGPYQSLRREKGNDV